MISIFKNKKVRTAAKASASFSVADDERPSSQEARFAQLSCVLTGRQYLDIHVVRRCWLALSAVHTGFEQKAEALEQAVHMFDGSLMADWTRFREQFPKEAETAHLVISAWYLGYTGSPKIDRTDDNAQFVTYENALMYEPTKDATVIPTYARQKTNFWALPPDTTGED